MHSDIHLHLHTARAAELRHEAAGHAALGHTPPPGAARSSRSGLRSQLGWSLVELGLRLVNSPAQSGARAA
ncbi:hypothetical protein QR77_12970 [Streptomyces sp. 150FB]|uniref:hypothetical protein n=1 Tax=Streptomyces sp. 150FB TaxID=1576605 RepID=UPI0005891ED7|nr:hypothetical protein [Streptomyces sp. 150FB]KIF74636.1 hypothetical protein QR77_12970 [Streptomyces sp. 150FB]